MLSDLMWNDFALVFRTDGSLWTGSVTLTFSSTEESELYKVSSLKRRFFQPVTFYCLCLCSRDPAVINLSLDSVGKELRTTVQSDVVLSVVGSELN